MTNPCDRRYAPFGLALLIALWAPTRASFADWIRTEAFGAPEAVQAAAADARFFYAIANTQIARYDRTTRQRVAVSTGDAKHLNSGFLHDGKLYCAHSNYPQVPEQSEIKVLDLETMQLSTWKDFGNFGGSLTWCVRRDDHWWCHFARYGDDNSRSFLVRFDLDWNETGRWTLPAELVGALGRYSLSGGIWRGDHLLVTGHDDPVLFRLKVPEAGAVLRLVGKEHAPFTGQGVAADPLTGGLVGIHRAQRQIVLAESNRRLRVLSYNIHHAEGIDGRLDLERIARVITESKADLVALQEVDRKAARTKSVDQPAELARLTGLHVAFGGNIELQGGDYGNAVLSRFPIRRHENHKLPCFENGEQRGVLDVEIEWPDSTSRLRLLATHLDHRRDDRERVASAQAINALVQQAELPVLLAGDLNDVSGSSALVEFGKSWARSNAQPLPTIPVNKPTRQIDFVLSRPTGRWHAVETRVLDEAVASDHRAILAILELVP
jgi:endonuclease/exonuclease/phosphatase family metal-dependent hydrolase